MAQAVKLNDGTFGAGQEWLHDCIYDRVTIANDLVSTVMFKNKVNDTRNGVTLTAADTNNIADRVPEGQKWQLWNLTPIFQASALVTDANYQLILDWLRNTIITCNITNLAPMFSVPLSFFFPTIQAISQPGATIGTRGTLDFVGRPWQLKVPIVLQQNAVWDLTAAPQVASGAGIVGWHVLFAWDRELFRQAG